MPIINTDFSEVDAPTANQIDFVQEIYNAIKRVCPIEMPEYTFEDYRDFISLWKDDYYDICNSIDYPDYNDMKGIGGDY